MGVRLSVQRRPADGTDEVVLQAPEGEPGRRYPCASDVKAEVETISNFPLEGTMNYRRLAFGLAALLVVAGLLLALFTPGGLVNSGTVQSVETPFGSFSVSEAKSSPWPVVGYVLLGLGGVAGVVGFAMKSQQRT
jgi:hypothetical protein